MTGAEETRAAMGRAHNRLVAAANAAAHAKDAAGDINNAVNSFAGSDIEAAAAITQLRRVGGVTTDPQTAGAALLAFWFGWELGRLGAES